MAIGIKSNWEGPSDGNYVVQTVQYNAFINKNNGILHRLAGARRNWEMYEGTRSSVSYMCIPLGPADGVEKKNQSIKARMNNFSF